MMRNRLLGVDEVMKILNVKKGRAYEIIRELNKELEKNGYRFIRGRINEKYLIERFNLELWGGAIACTQREEKRKIYRKMDSKV